MKTWHFYDRVYRRWVVFCIGPFEELLEELRGSEYKFVDELHDAKGYTIDLNHANSSQNCTMVWLKEYESSTLVHEICHLVMQCFSQVGVPVSQENNEAFAFYAEYWWVELNRARKRYPDGREPKDARK